MYMHCSPRETICCCYCCKVSYSIRRRVGTGLLDGEGMERLWAYLRRFSAITKEMTPSHRVDVLTDALDHFRERKISQLGNSLMYS